MLKLPVQALNSPDPAIEPCGNRTAVLIGGGQPNVKVGTYVAPGVRTTVDI